MDNGAKWTSRSISAVSTASACVLRPLCAAVPAGGRGERLSLDDLRRQLRRFRPECGDWAGGGRKRRGYAVGADQRGRFCPHQQSRQQRPDLAVERHRRERRGRERQHDLTVGRRRARRWPAGRDRAGCNCDRRRHPVATDQHRGLDSDQQPGQRRPGLADEPVCLSESGAAMDASSTHPTTGSTGPEKTPKTASWRTPCGTALRSPRQLTTRRLCTAVGRRHRKRTLALSRRRPAPKSLGRPFSGAQRSPPPEFWRRPLGRPVPSLSRAGAPRTRAPSGKPRRACYDTSSGESRACVSGPQRGPRGLGPLVAITAWRAPALGSSTWLRTEPDRLGQRGGPDGLGRPAHLDESEAPIGRCWTERAWPSG